jgi:hypothetical protein
MKTSNWKNYIGKLECKRAIAVSLIVIVMFSTPFLVEGLAVTGKRYDLSLAASQRFSTVILKACLTLSDGHHKKEAVVGALVYFYTCNSAGGNRREIGHSMTGRDGTATLRWSAPGNGNYRFIAAYTVKDNEKK